VSSAYNRAIADGAGFVVGPLFKDEVAAVAPVTGGRTPVLALNFLGETIAPPRNFYQFALLPEDEARMVARRMVADGRLNGVAIVPSGEWGTRVAAAFAEELKSLGGNVLDSGRYDPAQVDFSDVIKSVMQLKATKVEKGEKPEPPTHRSDAAFIFVAARTAGTARLILPQLKYNYSGDVPVYSTSDSFEPDPNANSDIDGMLFPDMPWMISNDPATAQIRDSVRAAWPARTARRDRLYAFGFDAYRLVPGLRSSNPAAASEIAGVTGKLHLDQQNKVRRDLDWAQIRGGAPFVL
jgi:outer membrane PBP1 activator LpoA protein